MISFLGMIIDISETVNISRSMRQMNYRLLNWHISSLEAQQGKNSACFVAAFAARHPAYVVGPRTSAVGLITAVIAATFTRELTAAAVGVA